MSWNNDHTPTVRIKADTGYQNDMEYMARKLANSGFDDLAGDILQDKSRMDVNIKIAVKKAAKDEVESAKDLVRKRQYHSKSGYVGHGNLVNTIKDSYSKGGLTADIAPHAESKDGYEYGQAFEFGLKSKNYPAQHPMRDSGRSLDVNKYADEALKNSIKKQVINIISPPRDLLTSAINSMAGLEVPISDSESSDSESYPQIIVYVENSSDNNRAKNEVRSSYTLNIDYYDIKDNNNSVMIDNCYFIRRLMKYLKLSSYSCTCVGYDERTLTDNSTAQTLRRQNMSFDYEITEKALF